MSQLSITEIRALDRRIDAGIGAFPALKLPRPVMALHLLRFYEDFVRLYALKMAGEMNHYLTLRKKAQDAMSFAMPWVMKRCPQSEDTDLSLRNDAYELCWPLFDGATEYSQVWDFLSLLFRGRAIGEWETSDKVCVRYTDPLASGFDVAGRLVTAPDPPGQANSVEREAPALQALIPHLRPRSIGGGKVEYEFSPRIFEEIKLIQRALLNHLWELNEDWNCGGYTIHQFREVWLALVTFASAHQAACLRTGAEGSWGLASVVPVKRRDRWEKNIVRWSNVPRTAVSAILDDLTFADELYVSGRKQPDITYQPFFPLGQDLLALSGALVLDSNAERNLWDLLSIIRPALHSRLRNEKEGHWILELEKWLSALGLESFDRLPVELGRERTDLDLLILDRANGFALGCQLKWLTSPDRIRDVEHTDTELLVGVRQAELSRRWLAAKAGVLSERLGMAGRDLERIHFEVAVLSKNTLGSSSVYREAVDVPVITERLLKWVLGDPHHANLEALWNVANRRTYFPISRVHYSDETAKAEFAAVQFSSNELGMLLRCPWTPEADIICHPGT